MAKLLKLRRGTTSQHSSFTGAEGEVTIDTDKDTAVVHDGSTAAGRPLAREDLNNVASASITGRLASGSIAGAKIANGAITSAHIAADTVVAADIAANSVGTSELAADAVTGAQIADNAIDSEHYVDGSIDAVHLADNACTEQKMANNAISTNKIVNDAVNSDKIAANAVGTSEIAANAVTNAKLANDAVANGNIINDAVNGSKIADNSIDSEHYADGSIDTAHIANSQVTADKLASNAVTESKIQNDAVATAKIATDAVTQAKIADAAVDEVRLHISNSGSNGQALTKQSGNAGGLTWATISPDGGNAATLDGIDSASFLRSDAADTASSDITFNGGANAINIAANSDIRIVNGTWSGDTTHAKIQHHNNQLYICGGTGGIRFRENGDDRCQIDGSGHLTPCSNNTYDLGNSSYRWRNIYTNDLNLSNEGSVNDVDGTWGNYTIQEGEDELFLLNRRNGKKYKFNLTEVN